MKNRKGLVAGAVTATIAGLLTGIVLKSTPGLDIEGIEHLPDEDGLLAIWPSSPFETAQTQDIRFVVEGVSKRSISGVEHRLVKLMNGHQAKGFQIKSKGSKEWSRVRGLDPTLSRVSALLRTRIPPYGVLVRAKADGYKIKSIKRDVNPLAVMATSGNDAIDLVVGTVVQKYPSVTNLGIVVCKKIAGSNTWSQHSWGNAVDFGGPGPWGSSGNITLLDKVNNYIQRLWDEGLLPVSQLGWRNWSGHFPGHIHVSGDPYRHGTPPCAG